MTERDGTETGADRYRRQRLRYGAFVGGSVVAAAIAGGSMFFAVWTREAGETIAPALAIVLTILWVVGMIASNWLYLKKADELTWSRMGEAALFGMGFLSLFYPAWLILATSGIVAEPDALGLYLAAIASTALFYYWKKFR